MSAENSASAWADQARRQARAGVWAKVRIAVGMPSKRTRTLQAAAVRRDHGAAAERATKLLLDQLEARGWHVRHDLQLRGRRFNVDHLAVSPCGTALVLLDTKGWHCGQPTKLVGGRLHCGSEDRHDKAEDVAKYAAAVAAAVGVPTDAVWPVLVVHGSPVEGGWLTAPVMVGGSQRSVFAYGAGCVVAKLNAAARYRDDRAAARLAARVDLVLRPYGS